MTWVREALIDDELRCWDPEIVEVETVSTVACGTIGQSITVGDVSRPRMGGLDVTRTEIARRFATIRLEVSARTWKTRLETSL